jgi:signal transduction histidine kinase
MGARLALIWAVLASVMAAVIERGNGDATLNLTHPDDWALAVLLLLLAGAGLIVVEGRRAVKAGYLLLVMGVGTSTDFLAHAVAVAALTRGVDGTWVQLLVWVSTWLFVPAIGVLLFVPALWPQGAIASSWLHPPTVVAAVVLAVMTVVQAFSPDYLDGVGPGLGPEANPMGVLASRASADAVTAWGVALLGTYLVVVLADLVWRYRRGAARSRAQLRPLVLVLAGLPVALAVGVGVAQTAGLELLVGFVAAGVFLLLGGLAWAVVRAENAERRGNRAMQQRRQTVEVAERERRKLRRDLHDGLGPGLAAINLQLEAVRQVLPPDSDEAAIRLARVEDTVAKVLEELRTVVDGLRPATLDELGLGGALASQGRSVSSPGPRAPIVEVSVDPELPSLPDAVEVALVRVSGEALANAVRHGSPTKCAVTLTWSEGNAVLRVADDGTGIDQRAPGHGLRTMRERVEELGGRLTVGPSAPRGTIVTAVIPIAP